jgi:hypothetical protein
MDVSRNTSAGTVAAYDGRPYCLCSEFGRIRFTADPAVFRPDTPGAVHYRRVRSAALEGRGRLR